MEIKKAPLGAEKHNLNERVSDDKFLLGDKISPVLIIILRARAFHPYLSGYLLRGEVRLGLKEG